MPLQGRILGVRGIDNLRSMIEVQRSEIIDAQYPPVGTQELPCPDETVGYVISGPVLGHLSDPRRAIAEGFRVLKPGGVAIRAARRGSSLRRRGPGKW